MQEDINNTLQQPLVENNPDFLGVTENFSDSDFTYESDTLPHESPVYITVDGKKAIHRRRLRNILFVIGNALLAGFLTLAREGYQAPFKYLISCVSLPMEIINLIAQIKNAVEKNKSLQIFLLIIFGSLLNITLLAITDAVKWAGWTSGTLATLAASGPFLFSAFMFIYGVLNVVGLVKGGRELYRKHYYRTPLKKLSVLNRVLRGGSYFLLAGLMIPFVFMLSANPFIATLLLVAIGSVAVGLIAWKIGKTVAENRMWKKTITLLNNRDPYALINVDRKVIESRLAEEIIIQKNIFIRIKNFLRKKWIHVFGDAEQKRQIKITEKSSVPNYIKQCYKYTLMPAKLMVDRLRESLCELQKKEAPLSEITQTEDALRQARAEYDYQKQHLSTHQDLALLQQAYDLLRKSKGRGLYEQAHSKQEEIRAALSPEKYAAIYHDEAGFSVKPSRTREPVIKAKEENVLSAH